MLVKGVTWGWLLATFKAIDEVSKNTNKINLPMFIATAGKDEIVDNNNMCKVLAEHNNVLHVTYNQSLHNIFFENFNISNALRANIKEFLKYS